MNKNMENIIKAYSSITNNQSKTNILRILSKSEIFNEIAKNNPAYLYEGYPANLLEIVEELKQQVDCPTEIYKITEESIVQYNKTQRALTSSPKASIPIIVATANAPGRIRPFALGSRIISASASRSSAVEEVITTTPKHTHVVKGSMVAAKKKPSSKVKANIHKKRTTT